MELIDEMISLYWERRFSGYKQRNATDEEINLWVSQSAKSDEDIFFLLTFDNMIKEYRNKDIPSYEEPKTISGEIICK